MTTCINSTILCIFVVPLIFVNCQLRTSQFMKTSSFFAFTHIDKKSPDDIEKTCLSINKRTPGTLYFGIKLFIQNTIKNVSCQPKNVDLKKIQKDIILDKHVRPLCRTTLTVSINRMHCRETVVDLNFLCQIAEQRSIYFQECKEVDFLGENETDTNEENAIKMSALPAPVIGNHGPVYNIPTVQCRLVPDASDNLTTKPLNFTTVIRKGIKFTDTMSSYNKQCYYI